MSAVISDQSKAKLMPSSASTDTIKRLIQSASVLVKQLDGVVARAKGLHDLFTPEAIEVRSQLSQLCAKSISANPNQCRRRAEELLWKKCYYDIISAAKTLSRKNPLTPTDKFYLGSHIDAGVAKFTEHLQDICSRLEKQDPPVTLQMNVFPLQTLVLYETEAKESREDLLESALRVLIWLGDLSRYQGDLGISNSVVTAQRLYQQAVIISPSNGLPFNQLGTLASHDSSRSFESMFYFIRSLKATKAFAGAGPNLNTLLTRLSASNDDQLTSKFSQLLLHLALEKKQESAFELGQLCQVALAEVQKVLQEGDGNNSRLLDLAAAVIMCAGSSPREAANSQSTAATAFCCSLFSHVLASFSSRFNLDVDRPQEAKPATTTTLPVGEGEDDESDDGEEEEETRRVKMRRRKVGSGSSETEFSDEELDLDSDEEYSVDGDSDEEEEALSDSGFHSAGAAEPPLELPSGLSSILPVLKIITDWFRTNERIVRVSSQSARQMWIDLARVLNALKRCQRDEVPHSLHRLPLEEDWKFYGVSSLEAVHTQLDFDKAGITLAAPSLAVSIRIDRILAFGSWLAEQGDEVGFKCNNGTFACSVQGKNEATEVDSKKTDLMGKMAHLWLKSEVQELERKLSPKPGRRRNKKKNQQLLELARLPFVYVVPDVAALTGCTQLIKQITRSQKLIVVIPDVVISEMDQLKKESTCVRDCIKWLESCFKNGNRFLRAQRPNEHQTIPLLTYPKRKDKANWTLFQILECCHYLDTHQRQVYKNGQQNAPVVLFLTGNTVDGEVDPQTKGVCSSIGIEIKTTDSLVTKRKPKKS